MTTEIIGWLNQNRYRSYPLSRDTWREKVSPESGLDRVLLDALVFDCGSHDVKKLVLNRITMSDSDAKVYFSYGDQDFDVVLDGSSAAGSNVDYGSYERVRLSMAGHGRNAMISLVFSSHSHLVKFLPVGDWDIGCPVMQSRVINLSDGYGVDRMAVKGSHNVDGHDLASDVDGEVVLEDGYRTSPIIHNGRILVRVGKGYGYNPCNYDYGEEGSRDCRKPLFFFCGQNAVNSGNIVLKGGVGITVQQGRNYTVRDDEDSPCRGKNIPSVEIIAGRQLQDMYRPSQNMGS